MRRALIVAQVALSLVLLAAGAVVVRRFERLLAADAGFLLALPGVTAVSATTTLPLAGGTNVTVMTTPGAPGNTGDASTDRAVADRIVARQGYVEAMGMRLIEGRGFARARTAGPGEALIDRHLAN